MTITNKKLIKNFKNILSSSISAKDIVKSEIDKVDEKYRKLAEQEKVDLNKQLETLDAQIAIYSSLLKDEAVDTAEAPVEEEKVVDTVFPENNAEEEVEEEQATEPVEEPKDATVSDGSGDIAWPEDEAAEEETTEEETEEDEWPDEPQEW